MRQLLFVLGLGLVLTVAGCGGGTTTYPVSGTVTVDGADLPEGDIVFVPSQPDAPREGGPIREGKFSFRARAGSKRVEITASRPDPHVKGPKGEPQYIDYIPAAYNTQSKLTAEVKSDGKNEFDFPIKLK